MREFFQRHRPAFLAFFGLTVPLFLLYVHGRSPRKTTIVEVALMKVTSPVQRAAARVMHGLTEIWDGYVALIDLHEENERLHGEIGLLKEHADRASQLELENKHLREMLDFKRERPELVTVGAHIVGKDVSPYARVLRVALDVGDGTVREDMPVINADGVVGRVHRVAGDVAEVMLLVDARSTVNVKVFGKGVIGTVTGTSSPSSYISRMSYLHKAEPLDKGDLLVTSGYDKVFPPGLKVGYIRSLDERQRGVEYELEVTPAVNFSDLDIVHVIVDVSSAPVAPPTPETP